MYQVEQGTILRRPTKEATAQWAQVTVREAAADLGQVQPKRDQVVLTLKA